MRSNSEIIIYKTIGKHVNNIFNDCELLKNSVVANFTTTAKDGKNYQYLEMLLLKYF